MTMPPEPYEYQGHDAIARFLTTAYGAREPRSLRLVPTRANTQPAFGSYFKDPHANIAHARGIFVLTLEGEQISAITRFGDLGTLPHFGLPRTLPGKPPDNAQRTLRSTHRRPALRGKQGRRHRPE